MWNKMMRKASVCMAILAVIVLVLPQTSWADNVVGNDHISWSQGQAVDHNDNSSHTWVVADDTAEIKFAFPDGDAGAAMADGNTAATLDSGANFRLGEHSASDGDLYIYDGSGSTSFDFQGDTGNLILGSGGVAGGIQIENTAGTSTFDVTGATGAFTADGEASLDGGIDVNGANFTVGTTGAVHTDSTLGADGLATLDGGIRVDTDAFTVDGGNGNLVSEGVVSSIEGTTSLDLTGANSGVTLANNSAEFGVTGGAGVTATDTQVTVLTNDGHGLTVDETTHTTTLTGGENSSTWTMNDAQATLGVGSAVAPTAEVTVFDASNNAGVTSVDIGSDAANSAVTINTADIAGTTTTLGSTNAAAGAVTTQAGPNNSVSVNTTNTIISNTEDGAGANSNYIEVREDRTTTIADIEGNLNTLTYGTKVNGGMLVDGDMGVNGHIYTLDTAANAAVTVGNNGLDIVGATNTVTLRADDDGLATTARGQMELTPTSANVTVNTATGVDHGLYVRQSYTQITGGTNSTSLTLDDSGATFRNDDTGGPAKVTGVADGSSDYDAVNYRQLNDVKDTAFGGIASVAALASIPSPAPGKKFSIGGGWGHFEGSNAAAVGGKAILSDNITLTAGAGFDDQENMTTSVGAGWSF
jgi:hypothetical protein